jgi:hypothetical protein
MEIKQEITMKYLLLRKIYYFFSLYINYSKHYHRYDDYDICFFFKYIIIVLLHHNFYFTAITFTLLPLAPLKVATLIFLKYVNFLLF